MCTKEIKLKITQRNMTYAVFWKGPNAKKRRLKKLCTVKKRQRWTTYWQYRWMTWFWTRNLFKSTNIQLSWLMLFFSRAAHHCNTFSRIKSVTFQFFVVAFAYSFRVCTKHCAKQFQIIDAIIFTMYAPIFNMDTKRSNHLVLSMLINEIWC